jgi:hypothetical protein
MPDNRFDDLFADANEAFNNDKSYEDRLNDFKGLTEEQINVLTPNTTTREAYNKLAELVNKATDTNMSQADLITNIKSLGALAIKIAKKVPALASLF